MIMLGLFLMVEFLIFLTFQQKKARYLSDIKTGKNPKRIVSFNNSFSKYWAYLLPLCFGLKCGDQTCMGHMLK